MSRGKTTLSRRLPNIEEGTATQVSRSRGQIAPLAKLRRRRYVFATTDIDEFLKRREERRAQARELERQRPSPRSTTDSPLEDAIDPPPVIEPTVPDLSGIEPPDDPEEGERFFDRWAQMVASAGGHRWLSTLLLWAGLACVVAWIAINLSIHGSSSASSAGRSGSGSSQNAQLAPHQHTGAVIWQHNISMSDGSVYGLDTFPPQQNVQDGIGPATGNFAGEALVVQRSTTRSAVSVALWHGVGAPSHRACVAALRAGTDYVQLGPPGISLGGWICERTVVGDVARLRWDGGNRTNGYRFRAAVWDH
jgi:hypothetical protein